MSPPRERPPRESPSRGKQPPTAFEATLIAVERAKEALVAAVPSPRGKQRRTVAEAVLEFEDEIREAATLMDGWRRPEVEEQWQACVRAIEESARRAERLRLEAPPLDYEGLVSALDDLIAPLEAFADADRALSGGPGHG
jgi:acyl-CoA reductase-like NAD-dependent aldehyde dehydrogenase